MFYLTLPSNSSMNYFPINTLTHYTTKLPKIMDLDGAWEIGLAEIQYPHSWYNVTNNEAWLMVHFYNESELQKHLVLLPDGCYSSAKRIVKSIEGKKHRTELKNKFHMFFNEINHKIDMKVKKDCQVIISPLLQSMLGFRQAKFPAGEYASDWVADVKKGLYSLYVYCPLVKSRMVGDAQGGHGLGSIFGGLFSDKNGTCTPQLMRMHEIRTGFI